MPFTFVFNGTYFELEHLFEGLNRFAVRSSSGALKVSGRLLTVQSVHLSPISGEAARARAPQADAARSPPAPTCCPSARASRQAPAKPRRRAPRPQLGRNLELPDHAGHRQGDPMTDF